MSNKTTALATAINGGKVSDKQAQSALGAAVDRIAGLSKRAKDSKEAMVETGTMVLHTAETQGSLFLSSLAEGYFGPDRLKIGSVDVRAPIGLLAQGYGIYETMSGRKGGGHALALGNGVMGSWLASVAVNAGKLLAEKRNAAGAQTPPAAQPPAPTTVTVTPVSLQGQRALPAPTLIPEPGLAGPVREVVLTEGEEVGRRRGGGRKRRLERAQRGPAPAPTARRRFIRHEQDEEIDEELEDFDPNE